MYPCSDYIKVLGEHDLKSNSGSTTGLLCALRQVTGSLDTSVFLSVKWR